MQARKIPALRRGQVFMKGTGSGCDELPKKLFPPIFRKKGKSSENLQVTLQGDVVISLNESSPVKRNVRGEGIQITTKEGLLPI